MSATIPDLWSYAIGNPAFSILLFVAVFLTAILLTIIVFRWWDRSHEHAAETALNNQLIQDMIIRREEGWKFNEAMIREINANAAILEQVSSTMAITNGLLAGIGGVTVAKDARSVAQPPTEEKKQ